TTLGRRSCGTPRQDGTSCLITPLLPVISAMSLSLATTGAPCAACDMTMRSMTGIVRHIAGQVPRASQI
ncbi:MAG: hypothetical protein ACK559_18365, partial [bacterium]